MGFERGFKAKANRISLDVRSKLGLGPLNAIDPARICAHFDIPLFMLSDLDCDASSFLGIDHASFSAVTVPCGAVTAIVHNESHNLYRQRSNISHELAHIFLGHKCTPPLTENGERARDSGIEAEANFLSGTLLIPNEAAINIVRAGLMHDAQEIYGVSQAMLEYRLRVSGAYTIQSRIVGARSRRAG